jgi:drug/metabolite transporter (DMT)-like permease
VNLIYLVPFLSLIVIGVVLGERILPSTVVGLLFIIAGIVLCRKPGTESPADDPRSLSILQRGERDHVPIMY